MRISDWSSDVCSSDLEVERLFAAVDAALPPLTALVNNAGLAGRVNRLEDAPADTIRAAVDLNLLGSIWCARAAIRRMARRHGGRGCAIVNLSSGAATIGSPGEYLWYAASKGSIDSPTLNEKSIVTGTRGSVCV